MIKRILVLTCVVVFGILTGLFVLSDIASAGDWTFTEPSGLGYTNILTDQFVVTNNNATAGVAQSTMFLAGGSYQGSVFFTDCKNCFYSMVNPIDGTRWVSDEGGNISYTTQTSPVNYSVGFYTAGVTGTCYSLGGNCNNLHRVATFTATTNPIKMGFDSSGNVYAADGQIVKKFVKSLEYSTQTFKNLTEGNELIACSPNPCSHPLLGIQVDFADNVHLLYGSLAPPIASNGLTIRHIIIDSSGTTIKNETLLTGNSAGPTGYTAGGLILDYVGPLSNYTYVYQDTINNTRYIKHNSTTGTVDVGGGDLSGITSIGDAAYSNYQIWVTSPAQNLIRTYVTNYQGYNFITSAPVNPDGITGTFIWTDPYGNSVITKQPGDGLTWKYTLDTSNAALLNYTYWVGWAYDTVTSPAGIHDKQQVNAVSSSTGMFTTPTYALQNNKIYSYFLARDKNGIYSRVANFAPLSISGQGQGTDSIILDKYVFNNSGSDSYTATFTYSDTTLHTYVYQLCRSADCRDQEYGGFLTAVRLLLNYPATDTGTINLPIGHYYAVLMQKFGKDPATSIIGGLLGFTVVDKKPFDVVAPTIAVNWEKTSYNLMPKSITSNPCNDSTALTSYFTTVNNWAGLQKGFLSCQQTPGYAEANNSVMKASLYSKYAGTFYLNNTWGSIWNGTLSNGSGQLIYVLTNSSPTGQWTLYGTDGTNTSSSVAIVRPESELTYTISEVPCGLTSEGSCYNGDTVFFTWTTPIYKIFGSKVYLYDAGGQLLQSWNTNEAPNGDKYFIDPMKSYTYGIWTATINDVGIATGAAASVTFRVTNAGRRITNGSVTPLPEGALGQSSGIVDLLNSNLFWAVIFTVGMMVMVAFASSQKRR